MWAGRFYADRTRQLEDAMTNPEASSEPEETDDDHELFDMDVEQNDPDSPGYLFGTAMGR